jgi:predicted nucleic acid-binding protein
MKFLIDTNVLSELFRPRPNRGVLKWAQDVEEVALSVISVEEIFYGLSWRPKPRLEERIVEMIDDFCKVLAVTDDIARTSARLRGEQQRQGRTCEMADMLIAATAQTHRLTLVTRNVRDFEGCGIAILDPFG